MAGRHAKKGLDYAPWSTDIFENDTKIDELIDSQGWIGFSIYFYLCQKAYASDGYFYRWSYANAVTTARRMGGGVGSETVVETVNVCLRIGLFDKGLFDVGGVLTSKGIQRRYVAAVESRRVREADASLWLLPPDETGKVNLLSANTLLQGANDNLQKTNTHLQTIESKGKESKGKEKAISPNGDIACAAETEIVSAPPVISLPLNDGTEYDVSQEQFLKWEQLYPAVDVLQELRNMYGWIDSNPANRKTRTGIKGFVTRWLSKSQNRGGSSNLHYGNRSPQTTQKTQNVFADLAREVRAKK